MNDQKPRRMFYNNYSPTNRNKQYLPDQQTDFRYAAPRRDLLGVLAEQQSESNNWDNRGLSKKEIKKKIEDYDNQRRERPDGPPSVSTVERGLQDLLKHDMIDKYKKGNKNMYYKIPTVYGKYNHIYVIPKTLVTVQVWLKHLLTANVFVSIGVFTLLLAMVSLNLLGNTNTLLIFGLVNYVFGHVLEFRYRNNKPKTTLRPNESIISDLLSGSDMPSANPSQQSDLGRLSRIWRALIRSIFNVMTRIESVFKSCYHN